MFERGIKSLLVAVSSVFLSLFVTDVLAQESHNQAGHETIAEHAEEEFNITETIMDHVKDSYGWHLWGHTTVHLPLILYTEQGWKFSVQKIWLMNIINQ